MPREVEFDLSSINTSMRIMREQQQAAFDMQNPVVPAFKALRAYIKDFESQLDDDHEVGARLVSFGQALTFHVMAIGYTAPSLVTFYGLTDSGDRVQLVQHVSQLSFLLMAVKKLKEKPTRIGFLAG